MLKSFCFILLFFGSLGARGGTAESRALVESALLRVRSTAPSEARDAEEARLIYWQCQYTDEKSARLQLAEKGLALMDKMNANESKDNGRLLTWIALKGEIAMLKSKLVALGYLKPLEKAAKLLKESDVKYGHYAADRVLGKLYHLAPALISIGSNSKARTHFEDALKGEPGYPENQLFFAEFLADVGEKTRAAELVNAALKSSILSQYPMERAVWETMGRRILTIGVSE